MFFKFKYYLDRAARQRSSPLLPLSLCIFLKVFTVLSCLTLFAFFFGEIFVRWEDAPNEEESKTDQNFTVLINTWKRHDLLTNSISHYAACPMIDSIRIVWCEPQPPTESLKRSLQQHLISKASGTEDIKLLFDIHKESSLNTRMKPLKNVKTDAIFSVDDDVHVPCETLAFAFETWRSAPFSMVGFVPRMHWKMKQNKEGMMEYKYGDWWSVWWSGSYSIVLSKVSFIHHHYFDLYTNQMPEAVREYVKVHRNCEDIAMSFVVANATNAPPIWVQGSIQDFGKIGISSSQGHGSQRSKCLNEFVKIFGKMPLVTGHVKAIDSRSQWFW